MVRASIFAAHGVKSIGHPRFAVALDRVGLRELRVSRVCGADANAQSSSVRRIVAHRQIGHDASEQRERIGE